MRVGTLLTTVLAKRKDDKTMGMAKKALFCLGGALLLASLATNVYLLRRDDGLFKANTFGLFWKYGELKMFSFTGPGDNGVICECDNPQEFVSNMSVMANGANHGLQLFNDGGVIWELCLYKEGRPYFGFTTDRFVRPNKVRYFVRGECVDEREFDPAPVEPGSSVGNKLIRPIDITQGKPNVRVFRLGKGEKFQD